MPTHSAAALLLVVATLGATLSAPAPGRAADAGGATFYVSPDGNDTWSGTVADANAGRTDGPFATPARARDAVRAARRGGKAAGGATVHLRGGTYALTEPLVLTPEDSGTAA